MEEGSHKLTLTASLLLVTSYDVYPDNYVYVCIFTTTVKFSIDN